jgi:choline dehydrogenase-like flavoprotein
MPTALIVGSGPAAAGVALALSRDPDHRIVVLDVGNQLEDDRRAARDELAAAPEDAWDPATVGIVSRHAVRGPGGSLPEKRAYGSDFPFRDVGQLDGVRPVGGANGSVVSGAYGGFSNVWGAQAMPFSAPTFDRWPFSRDELAPHYRAAADEMAVTGDQDDLATLFPLAEDAAPLPPLAERTRRVLDRYAAHRATVQSRGITLGRARLAMRAPACTGCGLCMTGCPYGLIYSASRTFDRLRAEGRVTYRGGVLAVQVGQDGATPEVVVEDLSTGRRERLTADRVFVACGGIGTTRLVLGSLAHFDRPVALGESVQFVLPAVSVRPTADPRGERDFTLNQFNLVYDHGGDGRDLCQIHFYPYNPVIEESLPAVLRHRLAAGLTTAVLKRASVGLGYLPSWASPRVTVTARPTHGDGLPTIDVGREGDDSTPPMLRSLLRALVRVAPALDLWPVVPMTTVSPAAKSYHFGGSFPHAARRRGLTTDRLGRLERWDDVHLVDASVFPDVPATTFTLTIMANAHRIATEATERPS